MKLLNFALTSGLNFVKSWVPSLMKYVSSPFAAARSSVIVDGVIIGAYSSKNASAAGLILAFFKGAVKHCLKKTDPFVSPVSSPSLSRIAFPSLSTASYIHQSSSAASALSLHSSFESRAGIVPDSQGSVAELINPLILSTEEGRIELKMLLTLIAEEVSPTMVTTERSALMPNGVSFVLR